jgi:hypothetical protein
MIVDRMLEEVEMMHFSPGTHFDHIRMKYSEYKKITKPILVDIMLENDE